MSKINRWEHFPDTYPADEITVHMEDSNGITIAVKGLFLLRNEANPGGLVLRDLNDWCLIPVSSITQIIVKKGQSYYQTTAKTK